MIIISLYREYKLFFKKGGIKIKREISIRDLPEVYISVDIESSGPFPPDYSMLSLGACIVGETGKNFYAELKPLTNSYVPEALAVCRLDPALLKIQGLDPLQAMTHFEQWAKEVSAGKTAVFTAFNATFDWMFTNYYFRKFLGRNPFGSSGLDIKAYFMGLEGCLWKETTRTRIIKFFTPRQAHTHHALDDAIEQAEIFEAMLKYKLENRPE